MRRHDHPLAPRFAERLEELGVVVLDNLFSLPAVVHELADDHVGLHPRHLRCEVVGAVRRHRQEAVGAPPAPAVRNEAYLGLRETLAETADELFLPLVLVRQVAARGHRIAPGENRNLFPVVELRPRAGQQLRRRRVLGPCQIRRRFEDRKQVPRRDRRRLRIDEHVADARLARGQRRRLGNHDMRSALAQGKFSVCRAHDRVEPTHAVGVINRDRHVSADGCRVQTMDATPLLVDLIVPSALELPPVREDRHRVLINGPRREELRVVGGLETALLRPEWGLGLRRQARMPLALHLDPIRRLDRERPVLAVGLHLDVPSTRRHHRDGENHCCQTHRITSFLLIGPRARSFRSGSTRNSPTSPGSSACAT